MFDYNDGTGESNILQNQFTAYFATAARRKKWRFLQNKKKQSNYEIMLDENEELKELQSETDITENLSILSHLENTALHNLLAQQKERNRYIFFAKILDERSFVEIASELEMDYKAVTSIYYRMIVKFKKELRGDKE